MKTLWNSLEYFYLKIINSIAFYPTLVTTMGLVLFFVVYNVEYAEKMISVKEEIPFLLVSTREDARLVLGTLVGSIISLMVFSFSMVMIVLNRASTSLTPRVLPGLISDRTHQIVLGTYIGTIIYCLLLIISFQEEGDHHIPSMGVLIAMIAGIACLCLFIFFIQSISTSIQVSYILKQIYVTTKKTLEMRLIDELQSKDTLPSIDIWTPYCVRQSGYLKRIDLKGLTQYAKKHDLQIFISKPIGYLVTDDFPLLQINNANVNEEILENISCYFQFYDEDVLEDHYLFGFRQISEIAVKSLSPGINDPGTAIKAIDFLTMLLNKRVTKNERLFAKDKDGEVRVLLTPVTFSELLFTTLLPIREYGKYDVNVLKQLLLTLKHAIHATQKNDSDEQKEAYLTDIKALVDSCAEMMDSSIPNQLDRTQLIAILERIRELMPTHLKTCVIENLNAASANKITAKSVCD